jgi:hypothetical protein
MRRLPPRTLLLAGLAVLLAGAAAAVAVRLDVRDLEERLVREANEVVAAPRTRPVHVDRPGPGALGEALARHLPAFEGVRAELEAEAEASSAVHRILGGDRPAAELPEAWAGALRRLEGDLDGLLLGTHAERADLAPADDPFLPANGASWAGYQLAARLSALRVRLALAAGRPGQAARDCLDGLALGRDAAIAGGLVGRMVRSALMATVGPACADAIPILPREERLAAAARLRGIRDAVPGIDAMIREEALQTQLLVYGSQLDAGTRARLLERPSAWARQSAPAGWSSRLLNRAAWRGLRDAYDELVRRAALDPAVRDGAFEALAAEYGASWSPLTRMLAPLPRILASHGRRDDAAVLRLDLVVLAAAARTQREDRGGWPESLDGLAAAGLLSPEERRRLGAATLAAEGEGELRVTVPLPAGGEGDPVEVRVRVRAP